MRFDAFCDAAEMAVSTQKRSGAKVLITERVYFLKK
jgi:hypothetical protein